MKKKDYVHESENIAGLFQISQRAIIFDPETKKFLLVRTPENDPKFPGFWGFIGGRAENGESATISLEREIAEEAGDIEYVVESVIDFDIRKDRARVSYAVSYIGGEIVLNDEHDDFTWKTAEEVATGEYEEKVKELVRKAEHYREGRSALDNWKRAVAEFENYKKSKMNVERDLAGRAVEDFAYRLLSVVDNFHASTDHIPEEQKTSPWVQGIMYIQKQVEQVLGEMGVVEIKTKEGDVFDPSMHEAVGESTDGRAQSTEENQKIVGAKDILPETEKIKKVLVRGYKRGERVVRPARVTVG